MDDLEKLIDGAFDFLCERRVDELVDVERVLAALDAVSAPPRVASLIERLVAPARQRFFDRLKVSDLVLEAWLPETVKDALTQLLGTPVRIPRPLIDRAVADERVRDQVRQTMHDALSSAVKKGFEVAPGGRGLKGIVGLAGAAGRGLFGGLAQDLEDRLRTMVDLGVTAMQQRVAQTLASDDTARTLGQRRQRAFLQLLATPERDAEKILAQGPHAILDALVAPVAAHNLARQPFRDVLQEEIGLALRELSQQPIGQWLDELGLRALMKDAALQHALPLLRAFVQSPHFPAKQ